MALNGNVENKSMEPGCLAPTWGQGHGHNWHSPRVCLEIHEASHVLPRAPGCSIEEGGSSKMNFPLLSSESGDHRDGSVLPLSCPHPSPLLLPS